MSETEEPPAKVLKIDNIDGVTHVTEVSEIPEASETVIDEEMLGEESGIIEGGADEPEQGDEGQEEWLSEGILTDDDFNPASQGDRSDRTDSQLETSHDEDQQNDSLEGLDNTTESETYVPERKENLPVENEAGAVESGKNMADKAEISANMAENVESLMDIQANIVESQTYTETFTMDCDTNITQSEDNKQNEANITQNEANITQSEDNIKQNEANITQSEDNIKQNEVNITQGEDNIKQNEANITQSEANITRSEANTTQSEAITSQANTNSKVQRNEVKIEVRTVEQNIEETMKHLDGNKEGDETKTDVLDGLLIEKSDIKIEQKTVKNEQKEEQDDGNDTDDLLRMLEEDDGKTKKKLTKTVKDIRAKTGAGSSDDDDDFVYEGAAVKKLKAAKNALAKKQPATRAEPEDMGDGDDETEVVNINRRSPDEIVTMKNMYALKSKPNILARHRSSPRAASTPNLVVKRAPVKNILNVVEKPPNVEAKFPSNKHILNKKQTLPKSILKSTPKATPKLAPKPTPKPTPKTTPKPTPRTIAMPKSTPKSVAAAKPPTKSLEIKREPGTNLSFKPPDVKTPAPFKASVGLKKTGVKREPDEIIDEEEFLDEDEFDLDEDEFAESDLDEMSRSRQRIMRPEMMDEEIPSDGESNTEDGSLYDELPSSDSDDLEDWFQLDIRAEKAGDYIPLLGSKAKELLQEEKRRVTVRLQNLKQSLSALTDSGKKQAEQLRDATMALAELDDMLKAS